MSGLDNQILLGDCRQTLWTLPAGCAHACVTSPPYWNLRSYLPADHANKVSEIGSEQTLDDFIATMVEVFRGVRHALRDDGLCFVNLGDSYNNFAGNRGESIGKANRKHHDIMPSIPPRNGLTAKEFKDGDQLLMPHRVAMALQDDGWWLRDTICWAKPSPMPSSQNGVRWERCRVKVANGSVSRRMNGSLEVEFRNSVDPKNGATLAQWAPCPGCDKCRANNGYILRRGRFRTTTAHEYIFMFAKSKGYFSDAERSKELCNEAMHKMQDRKAGVVLWERTASQIRFSVGMQGLHETATKGLANTTRIEGASPGAETAIFDERQGHHLPEIGGSLEVDEGIQGEMASNRGGPGVLGTLPKISKTKGGSRKVFKERKRAADAAAANEVGTWESATSESYSQKAVPAEVLHQHPDGCRVEGDQNNTKPPVQVLREEEAANDGSCDSIEQGRQSHEGECCGGVPGVQFVEGEQEGTRLPRSVFEVADDNELLAWLSTSHPDVAAEYLDAVGVKSVFRISPEPYKAAHFATYPSDLVRRCLLMAISAGGCCASCGAQYAPVVETERVPTRPGENSKAMLPANRWQTGAGGHSTAGLNTPEGLAAERARREEIGNRDPQRHIQRTKVNAYWPTCDCQPEDRSRCVVLDPFGGSGTTAQAAQAMGCDWILCELNEAYADLARERIDVLPKWAVTKRQKPIKPSKGQRELFA